VTHKRIEQLAVGIRPEITMNLPVGLGALIALAMLQVTAACDQNPAPAQNPASAQDPAPQIDPAPLQRPARLVAIDTHDIDLTFAKIRAAVIASGFAIANTDPDTYFLEAIRPFTGPPPSYDRVIIWLQRSVQKPLTRVDVYLGYGHFEEIIAEKTDYLRVVVGTPYIDSHVGPLKKRLLDLGNQP